MEQLVSLLPVIIGALISGISGFIATKLQARQTAALNNTEAMRGSFSEVLDALCDVRQSLSDIEDSQSGRQSEFTATTDEELQESRDRDAMGAASVDRMTEALSRVDRASVHMGAYASESVMQAYRSLRNTLHEDMLIILGDMTSTGVFVAAHFNTLLDDFDINLEGLALAMKEDLGPARIYRERRFHKPSSSRMCRTNPSQLT